MKIAMWSGPRNLSTAMMYSFGARSDCAVTDEPFYACYLKNTGLQHPMRDEILAAQSQNPQTVADFLSGPNPGETPIWYQKHMTQHMIAGVPRDWMRNVRNVFLIRHPARVVASYAAKRESVTLDDIGFVQQAALFDEVRRWGGDPVVIDSSDIRKDPGGMLERLCDAIGVAWSPQMLSWPKGGHRNDGVWAPHWYGSVWESTGFASAEGSIPDLVGAAKQLADAALPYFNRLKDEKL
ncbi:MAG: HAD family hydrolase [Pseudomonadota bacterium]